MYTPVELLCQVCGSLGLWLGISIVSLLEVFTSPKGDVEVVESSRLSERSDPTSGVVDRSRKRLVFNSVRPLNARTTTCTRKIET